MEHIVEDIIRGYHGNFSRVNLFSPATQFSPKNELITSKAKQYLLKEAENYKDFSFPYISASMFMNFKRTGNRTDFEEIYFKKRRVLNALVLGEYIEQNGRYMDDIINGIFSICEESAWQLPAHNSYVRDTPQLLLPDYDRPVMDLFACETGALLATIYQLFAQQFDEISPFINKRILSELEKRIIHPYLHEHFWWMGNGEEPMCNWTIWCTQNVLLTASQIPLPSDIFEAIVKKACTSTDYFLKEYGIDGCCDEGAQYYRHAGLCLFFTIDLLNQICQNAFSRLWEQKKIKNIAEYICNVHVEDIYYINYADCSPVAGRAGVREFLFGKAVKSPALCSFAALDFIADSSPYIPDEINLSYRLLTIYHEQEIREYAARHPKQIPADNIWYESVGIFIARSQYSCLAVKAGNNNDSHNHNDTGSIIFYHNGQPILIDVGVESYTLKTFSPQRYEIWSMQSGYHNLPTINGMDQLPGEDYYADNVFVSLYHTSVITNSNTENSTTDKTSRIAMELATAYPKECGIKSYRREVSFTPTGDTDIISCKDEFTFSKDAHDKQVILNFMSYDKPSFTDGVLTLGTKYAFDTIGVKECFIEEIPITDARLQITWKHNIYRIRFVIEKNIFHIKTASSMKISSFV